MMLAWHNDGSDTSEFKISYMELCNLTTDGARLVLQTTENPIQPWNFPGLTFRKVLTNRINIADDLELLLDISVDMTGITGDDGMSFTVYLCDNADGTTWNHVSWDFTVGGEVGSRLRIQDYDATIGETGESTVIYSQAWANYFDGVIKISRVAGTWYFYLDNTLLASSDFGQFGFSSIEFNYGASVFDVPRTVKPAYMDDMKLNHGEEPTDIPVTGVSLDKHKIILIPGENDLLTATVVPENASNKGVTWSSDNTDVATVNNTGLVTAVNPGDTYVYVMTTDGGYYDVCQVYTALPECNTNCSQGLLSSRYKPTVINIRRL